MIGRLSLVARERLDALLRSERAGGEGTNTDNASALLLKLRGSPERSSLASMQEELAKLKLLRSISLLADLFEHSSPRDLERCRQRVLVEAPHELRRHPDPARLT